MTTANKVTIARIALIPLFAWLGFAYGRSVQAHQPEEWLRWAAMAVFLIASATDGIDGYLARRYNQTSQLGGILDPIADKGLLLTAMVMLVLSHWTFSIPAWLPVVVVARELAVGAGALLLRRLQGELKVKLNFLGKTSTVTQMVCVSLVMLLQHHNWPLWQRGAVPFTFLDLSMWVAAFAAVGSGVGYVVQAWRVGRGNVE